ncbi:NUDIX hydrolase [Sporolactobacillus terrae]|uniref:8-oxo-dGTP diphosphatase n=1 Tax=Sporolactobacillus terrae TaxID=269673 RepID=A0A5K7X508_9BACL|nr:NUDIX domain-containing protein [Sporolactobacillus terrae]BBN99800.1 hypothetical protein St703_25050 [Sporolactobacillus terrae]
MFVVNVEAAINKNGKWLIIRRSEKEKHAAGLLSLVGGKVDQTDRSENVLENALKRELAEELNIKVFEFSYVKSESFVAGSGGMVIDIVFFCHYKSGELKAMSQDEVADIYWMTTKEVLEHPKAPDYLKAQIEAVDQWAKYRKK